MSRGPQQRPPDDAAVPRASPVVVEKPASAEVAPPVAPAARAPGPAFALGAGSSVGFGLSSAPALMGHAFAAAAWPRFTLELGGEISLPSTTNRADGAGYDFLADTVLALDPKNPQVAARLATAFRTWRTLESGRRTKA